MRCSLNRMALGYRTQSRRLESLVIKCESFHTTILQHSPSPTVLRALPHRTNMKPYQILGSLPSNQPSLNTLPQPVLTSLTVITR